MTVQSMQMAELIKRRDAEIERLRAALKEIAENSHDIQACACAWGALMRMKRAHEQSAGGEVK